MVDLRHRYLLGPVEVDPNSGEIRRDDNVFRLQPIALAVLGFLAGRPRHVISRDEIESAVWDGRIVGYDSLTAIMFKLRKALGDDPKNPELIETIPKKGYRLLVVPVPVSEPVDQGASRDAFNTRRWQMAVAVGALVLVVLAAVPFVAPFGEHGDNSRTMPDPVGRTLAVLPFDFFGSSEELAYLAQGMTDDLATALTRDTRIRLISQESTSLYVDSQLPDREIAQRLGVATLLRGSVHVDGTRLHINIRLIDAPSSSNLWADTYTGALEDLFKIEERILRALAFELSDHSGSRELLVRTSSPRAYRAFQLGRQSFYLFLNRSANEQARQLFRKALAIDPDFAMAHVMLGWTYAFDAVNGWAADRAASLALADGEVRVALAMEPDIPLGYFLTGLINRERGDYLRAMVEAQKAIDLDPSFSNAQVLSASLLYYTGHAAESVEPLKKAMVLNPHHPYNYEFHLGQAYFVMGEYRRAIDVLNTGLDSNPAAERLHVWLAASYAGAGKLDDAAWEVEQVLTLNPEFSIATIEKAFPFKFDEDRTRFIEALKLAGFS